MKTNLMQATQTSDSPRRVGIVAALKREIWPLVQGWTVRQAEYEGRKFEFFESGKAVVLCGGIGRAAALFATKVMVDQYEPIALISCGLSGSIIPGIPAGKLIEAARVIDVAAAKSYSTASGDATLLTVDRVLGANEKLRLAEKYRAQAVDMEAAAVAEVAVASNLPFLAIKAISDELDFPMPPMDRFINADGSFANARFAMYVAMRPAQWHMLLRLAQNSATAAKNLCQHLQQLIETQEFAISAIESKRTV